MSLTRSLFIAEDFCTFTQLQLIGTVSSVFRTSPLILPPFDGNKGMVGWLNNYFLDTKRP